MEKDFTDRDPEKNEDTVTISQEKYDELIEDSNFLNALRAAGVDNWDGYENAQDIIKEWNDE
jgi:hypothetical protein